MRAALYARASTDGQSTQNQLRELREVAKRTGWKVVEEFVDHGGSVYRPAYFSTQNRGQRQPLPINVLRRSERRQSTQSGLIVQNFDIPQSCQ